jgi:hypothetical protein
VRSWALRRTLSRVVVDNAKKCRGVYVVGSKDASRSLDGPAEFTGRLLSRAGRPHRDDKETAAGSTSSRCAKGGIAVLRRWADGVLVGLRIGDASPWTSMEGGGQVCRA